MQNNNQGRGGNGVLQFLLGCCGLRNRNHRRQQQEILAPMQEVEEVDGEALRQLIEVVLFGLPHEQKIITEFTKLIKGEIQEVNIPGGCNRSGIQVMIESAIKYSDLPLEDIYVACRDGVISTTVEGFLTNVAKYATASLSDTNNSDIKITKQKLLEILSINNIYGNDLRDTEKNEFNDVVESMGVYGTYNSQLAKLFDDIQDNTEEGIKELFAKQRAKNVPQFNIEKFREKYKNNALQNQQNR